jgi:hypothetical protein
MSDGMSEASAFGRQEQAVRDAAHTLAVALKDADTGVRGWSINRADLVEMVNDYLKDEGAPFRLRVSE